MAIAHVAGMAEDASVEAKGKAMIDRQPSMMNVCFQCGLYRADKMIDPAGPYAICPE